MYWHKINSEYWIDMAQVCCFGISQAYKSAIFIKWKHNDKDSTFFVDNVDSEMKKLEEIACTLTPIFTIEKEL